jgi:hypothetical protein
MTIQALYTLLKKAEESSMDAQKLKKRFMTWMTAFDKLEGKEKNQPVATETVMRYNELLTIAVGMFPSKIGMPYPPPFKTAPGARPRYVDFAAMVEQVTQALDEYDSSIEQQSTATPSTEAAAKYAARLTGSNVIKGAKVDFVAPRLGTNGPITGRVTGLTRMTDYRIAVLVSHDANSWWDKTHNVGGVPIRDDGTFTIAGWVVDIHDLIAPNIGIWVVPLTFDVVQVAGSPLPEELVQAAVTALIKGREAGPMAIDSPEPDPIKSAQADLPLPR